MRHFIKRSSFYINSFYNDLYIKLNKKKLPDFLIIGAMKSGTTSLYQYLIGHPEILGSAEKEPSYFSWKYNVGIHNYLSFLPDKKKSKGKLVFEASATYLHDPLASKRIKQILPNVKIIAILRDPIERAISHYYYHSNPKSNYAKKNPESLEKRDVENAFLDDINRITKIWDKQYCHFSLYGEQLKSYYELFDNNKILVLDFEMLSKNPREILLRISDFLEIAPSYFSLFKQTDNKIDSVNSFTSVKKKELSIYNAQNYSINISQELENKLLDFFKKDVSQLIDLTHVNFHWSKRYL